MKWPTLFCILLFSLTSCQERESPPPIRPVRTLCLKEGLKNKVHVFPGLTRAAGRVTLSFRVEGPLIERPVKVGDRVSVGQLLARIDPRDFETYLKEVKGEYEQTKAELRYAQGEYERSKNIYAKDPGAISQSILDRKKEDVQHIEGQMKTLEAKVEAAENQLSYTCLISPYEGTIVATYVENHEFVHAKQPIVRLLNNQQVEMLIDVPESIIGLIPQVLHVYVQFDALGDRLFEAVVKEIGEEASFTTRTYPVTLLIDSEDKSAILAGMAGRAYLEFQSGNEPNLEGFLIPSSALMTDPDLKQSYVWIVEEGKVSKKEVKLGNLAAEGVLVTQGLDTGMCVVTSGVQLLHEGQEITIMQVDLSPQGDIIEKSN